MRSRRRATPSSKRAISPRPRRRCAPAGPAVVLSDLRLPEGDGFGVLRAAKELDPELPVIVMTAFGSIQDAVAAMKEGALDFLAKPVDPDHLLLMVERALAQRRLATENMILKEELAQRRGAPQIVGEDPQLKQVSLALHRAAATDTTVLLEGESGTGKELFARALHALSPRADGPFVAINCAAIPETLLETELFGHEKGAFTGASARKPGKFELAHRGTLFLDEIGDLPLTLQAKILRALEEKRFERVGGTLPLQVDVRVVAATNRNLKAAVAARQYREDLYFRLSVFPITIPPLRERAERHPDAGALLHRPLLPRSEQDSRWCLSPSAEQELLAYPWPGNVRELQNCIERAVILTEGDTIHAAPPEPVVSRRCGAVGRGRQPVGADRSVRDAGRGVAPRDRRGRAAKDRAGVERGGRQPRPRRGDAADQLQDAGVEAEGVRPRRAVAYGLKPTFFSAAFISFSVTSSTIVVAPIAVGSTKCSRAGDDLLVVLHRLERSASPTTSAIGGSGPRLAIEIGERLSIALGQRAARRRQLGGDQHAVADRFAVAVAAVFGDRFERVAGGMAEVQDPARAGFPLVGGDDVGLDPARLGDDRR